MVCNAAVPCLVCAVVLGAGQSIEAIDISDPEHPVKLASQRCPTIVRNAKAPYEGKGDGGHDLVYRGGLLYVTEQNDACLMILRVNSEQIRSLAEGTSRR